MMNMVPDNGENDEELHYTYWRKSSHLQPMEKLGCHPIGEFIMNNQSVMEKLFTYAVKRKQPRLIETLINSLEKSE